MHQVPIQSSISRTISAKKSQFSDTHPLARPTKKKTSPAFAGYTVIGIPEEAFARGDLALEDEQSIISKIPGGWLKCWVIQSISDLVWWRLVQFKEHGYNNSGHNGIHSDCDPKNTDIESNRTPTDRLPLGNDL